MKEVKLIVIVVVLCLFVLSLVAVGGGIYAIHEKSLSDSKIHILGAEVNTGHVGVAFLFIGFMTFLFTVRYALKVVGQVASHTPGHPGAAAAGGSSPKFRAPLTTVDEGNDKGRGNETGGDSAG